MLHSSFGHGCLILAVSLCGISANSRGATNSIVPPAAGLHWRGSANQNSVSWAQAKIVDEEFEQDSEHGRIHIKVIAPAQTHYPIRIEEVITTVNANDVVSRWNEMAADHILVKPRAGIKSQAILAALQGGGIASLEPLRHNGWMRAQLKAVTARGVANALTIAKRAKHLIEFSEPDYVIHTQVTDANDPGYTNGDLWGLRNTGQSGGVVDADIDAVEAWDIRTDASSVIVAVVDTGIRYTHLDLSSNMWTNPGEVPGDGIDNDGDGVVDDLYGYNAVNNSGNPFDDNGHGTHVAGTIGAYGNNSVGTVGVAWRVKLMAVKFIGADGSGFSSDAVEAIDFARLHGAQVMNNSWGGGGYSQSLVDAIERARQAGIIFVAAAGNNSTSSDVAPLYPASYPHDNIISVAASTRSDTLASFSNFGSRNVDLAAPGSSIYSTYYTSDTSYTSLSGTSMASPHVAGAMAMLKAHFPTDSYSQLIDRVLATADHPSAFNLTVRSRGRLNLARALSQPTIISLPKITVQPAGATVLAGASTGINVSATGTSLSYQWRLNGIDVTGATTSTIALANVQATNAGRYSVLITNVSGVALSDEAVVSVLQPVAITTQPAGATLFDGATFKTEVAVTGDQPIFYQWRKTGVPITGANASSYSIYGVSSLDIGNYSVIASNSVSSITSSIAVLSVFSPPVITSQPGDASAAVGGSCSFNVGVTGTFPFAYQWFKDGALVTNANSSILNLSNLQFTNAGSYSVRVTNVAGIALSTGAGLTITNSVTGYPQFTLHPLDQAVNLGTNVSLSGIVSPTNVAYQWRKDAVAIAGATTTVLTLTNVSAGSAGIYTLIASNSVGVAASRGARITIRQAPSITQQPQSAVVTPGAQVMLESFVSGTPPLVYQWYKDGQAIAGATTNRFFIASVGPAQTGSYHLVVSNPAGAATSSIATISFTTASVTAWRQLAPGLDMGGNSCATGGPDGIYVASHDGGLGWSPDGGQTWTHRRPALTPGENIHGLAYGKGLYVGGGSSNNVVFSIVSSDGVTWKRYNPSLTYTFKTLSYDGAGLFYGVSANYFAKSSDGVSWSQTYITGNILNGLCKGTGRYVAVGNSGIIYTSPDGSSWSPATSATTNHLYSVCFGDQGFVASGNNGTVIRSTNGLNWIACSNVTSQPLQSIAFGNGRFVAVGSIYYPSVTLVSSNAVDWRRVANPSTPELESVTFANGMFIAVGGTQVITSENGEQWTQRSPVDQQRLYGIAYGNGTFVSVGFDGVIRNSQDGINWFTSHPGNSQNFFGTTFGNGRFVIGAEDGGIYTSTNRVTWQRQHTGAGAIRCLRYLNGRFFALTDNGEILTSPDSESWTRVVCPTGAALRGIEWTGSLYVIAGFDGTILTSADGNNWVQQATPSRQHMTAIAAQSGKLAAVGYNGNVFTSTNGSTWTLSNVGTNVYLAGVAGGNGMFAAVTDQGLVFSSPDGQVWTPRSSGTTYPLNRIQFLNGRFVAVGQTICCTSTDGITWSPSSCDYFQDVTYGNSVYMAVGLNGRLFTATTLPGSWTSGSIGSLTSYILTDVKYQNNKFIACGRSGNILTSADGQTWTEQNSGWTSGIERIAYGAGRYVAVGISGVVLYSTNATNWSHINVSGVSQWIDVIYGGGQFVAVGYPGCIATSSDGINWVKRTIPPTSEVDSIAYGNSMYVAGTFDGEILSSPDGINWSTTYTVPNESLSPAVFSRGRFMLCDSFYGNLYVSTNGTSWSVERRSSSGYVDGMLDFQGATFSVGLHGVIAVSAPLPTIIAQPVSQTVRIGTPFDLTVTATNAGVLSFQWFKDGKLLSGETSNTLSRVRAGTNDIGTYFVRLTGLGGTIDSINAVVTVTQQSVDAWRIAKFGYSTFMDPTKEQTVWGWLVDPDGDGISNLSEYAHGTNPMLTNAPSFSVGLTNGQLTVVFRRRKNDPNLTVTPEVSGNLETWNGGASYISQVQVTPIDAEIEEVTVKDVESPSTPPRFLRMLIRLVP